MEVTAPNGVTWRRRPGGTSSAPELLHALEDLRGLHDISRQWDWWQEHRRDQEHDAVMRVLEEWDNGAPAKSPEEVDAFVAAELKDLDRQIADGKQRRAELVAESYDEEREHLRLSMLRTASDLAFFTHILAAPTSPTQQEATKERVDEARTKADELRDQLGDPEDVVDRHGFLPAERRTMNLRSHMDYWRHPRLREWAKTDRRRFNALLKMPMPDPGDMCSECQAPAEWHEYDLSLRLFQSRPEPGSQAESLSHLMPGWWERCPACTAYNIRHRWGGDFAIPEFDGDQSLAMLPSRVRSIFVKAERKPSRRRKATPRREPLAVIPLGPIGDVMAQLADAQAEYPDAQVRRGKGDGWEVWPS